MTTYRDPDGLIRAFIREGEEELHDQVYDAIRAAIEHKRQRAVLGPWRTPSMNKFVTFGLAAAAVVVLLLIGVQLLGSGRNIGDRSSSDPIPSPEASLEPTATPEPTLYAPPTNADGTLVEGPVLVWDYGEAPSITMTISTSGWAYGTALPGFPATWLSKSEEVDNMPEAQILPDALPAGTEFYVFEDPCQSGSTRPDTPATTVDEIVDAITAPASRDASEPVDVTLGGYAGKMVTLHVPDDMAECDGGRFDSYTIDDEVAWQWHQGPGQIDDFWFIDVDGSVVTIRAAYRPDTPDELVEEMRNIVETSTFELP